MQVPILPFLLSLHLNLPQLFTILKFINTLTILYEYFYHTVWILLPYCMNTLTILYEYFHHTVWILYRFNLLLHVSNTRHIRKSLAQPLSSKLVHMFFHHSRKLGVLRSEKKMFFVFPGMYLHTICASLPDGTYIFKPKITIWLRSGGSCNGRCRYIW
jgi:hypothetical protein